MILTNYSKILLSFQNVSTLPELKHYRMEEQSTCCTIVQVYKHVMQKI